MSDTIRYDPDCSYCFRGVRHDIERHHSSISLTARCMRMCGDQTPSPCPSRLRIRLSQLADRRERLEACIAARDASKAGDWGVICFLRRELEIVASEIALLKTELEAAP